MNDPIGSQVFLACITSPFSPFHVISDHHPINNTNDLRLDNSYTTEYWYSFSVSYIAALHPVNGGQIMLPRLTSTLAASLALRRGGLPF